MSNDDSSTSKQEQILSQILSELKKKSTADTSDAPRRDRPHRPTEGLEGEQGRYLADLEKEVAQLENKQRVLGEIDREESLRLAQVQERLELQRQLAEEEASMVSRDAIRQKQLDQLAQQEGKLSAAQQQKYDFLKKNIGATTKKYEELAKEVDDLEKGQDSLNTHLSQGSGKFEVMTNSLLKVDGAAYDVSRMLPLNAEQLVAWGMSAMEAVKSGEIFIRVLNKLVAEGFNLSVALDQSNAALSRSTALYQESSTILSKQGRIMRAVEKEHRIAGVTSKEVADAQGALQRGMADYTRMADKDRKALASRVALMAELGVNTQTGTEIFDKATKSLGMGTQQAIGLTDELHQTAQSLGVPFEQVAADFNFVATELAFYGDNVTEVFKGLSKQSKATGLSMQQLLKVGGKAFDTFDGAAQKVGRLNAILGGPYLNSIDMLNASEEERIELLKGSMDASGRMFQDLGKYEQLAIADALGVSQEEARRLFGNLDAAQEMDIRKKEEMAETARKAQAIMDKFANALLSLVVSLDFVIGPLGALVELFSWFISTKFGKVIGMTLAYGAAAVGLVFTIQKLGKGMLFLGKAIRLMGLSTRSGAILRFGGTLTKWGRSAAGLGSTLLTSFKSGAISRAIAWLIARLAAAKAAVLGLSTAATTAGSAAATAGTTAAGAAGGAAAQTGLLASAWGVVAAKATAAWGTVSGLFGAGGAIAGLWSSFTGAASAAFAAGTGAASLFVAGVLSAVGNVTGAVMGFVDVWSGLWAKVDGFWDTLLALPGIFLKSIGGALMGIVRIWGQLVEKIGQFTGLWDKIGGIGIGNAFDYIFKRGAYAVDDAIITPDGKIIEPHPQDTIVTAKPGGPLSEIFGAQNPSAKATRPPAVDDMDGVFGTPLFAGLKGILTGDDSVAGSPERARQEKAGTTVVKFDNGAIVVKIGEEQLRDVILKSLKDPEVSRAISGLS